MKILLVRPPVPRHTIGLKHIMICEPLELEYVAAGLKDHELQIMDMILEKGFLQRLRNFQPDIVVSTAYITGVNEVIKLFRKTKTWKKDCLTVTGGVQASLVPEDFIDPSVDVIVKGDGTTLMPQIVEAWEQKHNMMHIPNLAFPKRADELIHTENAVYLSDINELSFPNRSLVAHLKDQYYYLLHRPVSTMKTTWGCWYQCNFCYTWRITGGTPHVRSAESIALELLSLESKEVYIVDDIFLIKPSRLHRLAELIRKYNIKKNYLVYARSDFIAENEELIAEWADLGLKAVFIGLEAVTDDELSDMDKENSVQNNKKAIRILQKHGVDIYGSLIPRPDYTREDWKRLRRFIKESGLYYLNISPLQAMPGTMIWEQMKDQVTVPRKAHGLWDLSHVLLKTHLPLKSYYRELLKTYAMVIWNVPRASRVTQRTLPSIWTWNYILLLWGTVKIGWQFLRAHSHHSKKEIEKAMDKGPDVDPALGYAASRLSVQEELLPVK